MIDGSGNVFLLHYLALFNLNHLSLLLVDMGPAVLNGGLSTLIAFILLLSSDSHVFSSFFKIFMLVVLFGVSFQWQRRCFRDNNLIHSEPIPCCFESFAVRLQIRDWVSLESVQNSNSDLPHLVKMTSFETLRCGMVWYCSLFSCLW